MAGKYYLDTSIWLDFYEKRGKRGAYAIRLITKIIARDDVILFSDWNMKELRRLGYTDEEIVQMVNIVKPKNMRRVHINKEQRDETRHLHQTRAVPVHDILHAIIARDNEAILICTDRHFKRLKDIVVAKKPEELL